MIDSNEVDEKLSLSPKDPSLNTYKDISELPQHTFSEISHFF